MAHQSTPSKSRVWTLLTYAFSHQSGWHLAGNMLGLYFFGYNVAYRYGGGFLLVYYLAAAVASGIAQAGWSYFKLKELAGDRKLRRIEYQYAPGAIGASGAVTAIVILGCCTFPTAMVYVYGVIPLPSALFGVFYVLIDAVGLVGGNQGGQGPKVGYAGHLGGAVVLAVARKHQNILEMNVADLGLSEHFFAELLPNLQRLRHLTVGASAIGDGELLLISQHLPALEVWTFAGTNMGRTTQAEVLLAHPHAHRLSLAGCRSVRIGVRCPALRSLALRGSVVTHLAVTAPALVELDLRGVQKLADSCIRVVLTQLMGLQRLDLGHNLPLTDDTLREAGQHLQHLTWLSAAGCIGLTLSMVRGFPALREANFSNCDSLAPATAVPALESWTLLEELILDNCISMMSVTLSLPRLRVLSLRGCRALAQVDVRCGGLEALHLGSASAGTAAQHCGASALKCVVLASNALTAIRWRGFLALEMLALACTRLAEVEISDCDSLSDGALVAFGDRGSRAPGSLPGSGCPNLRALRLENCEALAAFELHSTSLQRLSIVACKGVRLLRLACPALRQLVLEECDQLQRAVLRPVGVEALALGTCPSLAALELAAPCMRLLDIRGCGVLAELSLNCPSLAILDATFCARLGNAALAGAIASAPPLQSLVLSVCQSLDAAGLQPLQALQTLRVLDLSYTEIQGLEPVFSACPGLHTLKLSSCVYLRADALAALLPGRAADGQGGAGAAPSPAAACPPGVAALPSLTELDVSYCPLPTSALADILGGVSRLQVLAISGCLGATADMWRRVSQAALAPRVHALHSLIAVGCKKLRTCWLGVLPSSPRDWAAQERLLTAGMYAPSRCEDASSAWTETPTTLAGLRTLRLGLSGVRSLALALPSLTALDLNRAGELRCLELRCPALLVAYAQGCKLLSGERLDTAFSRAFSDMLLDRWQVRRGPAFNEALAARLELERTLLGHSGCVNRLAWSDDGMLLSSGSDDRMLCIWSYPTASTSQRLTINTEHEANIFGVRFLPCSGNRRLVSAGMDGTVQLHTLDAAPDAARSGRGSAHGGSAAANTIVYRCHESRVKAVEVEPGNANLFWSAGEDGFCRQFDWRCSASSQGHPESANVLVSVPENQAGGNLELKAVAINAVRPTQLALACSDLYVRVFDRRMLSLGSPGRLDSAARSCNPLLSLAPPHLRLRAGAARAASHTTHVAFGAHGDRLVANYNGDHAYAFDVTREGSCSATFAGPGRRQHAAQASRGAEHIGIRGSAADLSARANRAFRDKRYTEAVWLYTDALRQSPGSVAASLHENRAAALLARDWAAPGTARASLLRVQALFVLGLVEAAAAAVSAYERSYPNGAADHPVLNRGPSNALGDLADRDREAAAELFESDDAFHTEQVPGDERVLQRFIGHINVQTDIKEATFLGGDSLVAVGSDDGCVWIYAAETGRPVAALAADQDVVNAVQAHPHLPVLATSGIESTVKLWSPGEERACDLLAQVDSMRNNQDRMSEGPQLLPGVNPSLLVRLSERPELLNMLLARAAAGYSDEEEGRPEVACRMA
ncbi:hypothetical protein WJX81_007802 [Elliptochloris bilobata]|uniref:Peptidase S54 rhomboid domain-containing protein n=1 Tax=Elliptochloris bilobata TaxID=381761 RepID=A0AAW1RQR7_9CHLO